MEPLTLKMSQIVGKVQKGGGGGAASKSKYSIFPNVDHFEWGGGPDFQNFPKFK